MFGLRKIDDHAALVDRMATRGGVDLGREMMTGRIPAEMQRAMVLRCMGCTHEADCRAQPDDDTGRGVPGYCRNHDVFTAARQR